MTGALPEDVGEMLVMLQDDRAEYLSGLTRLRAELAQADRNA